MTDNLLAANGGIGFELARQLLADPKKHVLLGSRSIEKGENALKELQSQQPKGAVEVIQVDVASEDSVAAAAKEVENRHGRYVNGSSAASFWASGAQPHGANCLQQARRPSQQRRHRRRYRHKRSATDRLPANKRSRRTANGRLLRASVAEVHRHATYHQRQQRCGLHHRAPRPLSSTRGHEGHSLSGQQSCYEYGRGMSMQ